MSRVALAIGACVASAALAYWLGARGAPTPTDREGVVEGKR